MCGAEQSGHRPHSTTPTHNEKGQAIHCWRLLLYQSYDGMIFFNRTNEEEEEREEQERGREREGRREREPWNKAVRA